MYGNDYFLRIYYSPLGVDENEMQDIEIYPNPAKNMLTVKAESLNELVIYNSVGQKVFSKTVGSPEVSIHLEGFDTGIYLVKLIANGKEVTRKISIIK